MSPTKNSDGKTTHASKADDGKSTKPGVASFTSADAGSCLTWQDSGTTITAFEQTDCGGPHRFEVSSREDLSTYPSSEFGAKAAMPNTTRQAQLREELCMDPTMKYLGGTFDPLGRYSVASILPPQAAWNAGDRTLLCGIQATDEAGKVITTNGKVAQQDQARIFGVGECVAVDGANSEKQIDCRCSPITPRRSRTRIITCVQCAPRRRRIILVATTSSISPRCNRCGRRFRRIRGIVVRTA